MKAKGPREAAARALCQLYGQPENTQFEGRPMWQSYLRDVDAVLRAALTPEELVALDQRDAGSS